jgi:hypothetical protein
MTVHRWVWLEGSDIIPRYDTFETLRDVRIAEGSEILKLELAGQPPPESGVRHF